MWITERRAKAPGIVALLVLILLEAVISDATSATLTEVLSRYVSRTVADVSVTIAVPEDFPWLRLILFAIAVIAWLANWDRLARGIIYVFVVVAAAQVTLNVFALLLIVPFRSGSEGAVALLLDAVFVWLTNLLVFAIWYWMLDRGGPDRRGTPKETRPDFLFTMQQAGIPKGWEGWQPKFTDYLYLAFSACSTFSAGETLALSRRVKWLVMWQALQALVIILVLAGRAVNIFSA
jgi:hypothetical protein